jgi:hypothetical protein
LTKSGEQGEPGAIVDNLLDLELYDPLGPDDFPRMFGTPIDRAKAGKL